MFTIPGKTSVYYKVSDILFIYIYICVINKLQKCRMHFTTIICHNGYMMSMSHSYAMTTVGLDKTLNIITYKDGERTQTNNK